MQFFHASKHTMRIVSSAISSFIILFFVLFTFSPSSRLIAQQSYRFVDAQSKKGISSAHLILNEQLFTTNEEGTINLPSSVFEKDEPLLFSHQSYGRFALNTHQLSELQQNKQLLLQQQAYHMAPVSVIAARSGTSNVHTQFTMETDLLQHDATELAMSDPSVSAIRKSGGYGFDPVLRGFKYDRLNVVQSGLQTAMAACPNRMDPPTSQMVINAIEKVEIIKGPYALRYGVGLGGTLNYETAKLTNETKSTAFGRFSSAYESNGELGRGEAKLGFGNDQRAIALLGSWSQGADYVSGNDSDVAASFQRGNIGLQSFYSFNDAHTVDFHAQFNWARDTDFPALPMDLRNDDTWMIRAKHRYNAEGWSLTSAAFASVVDHRMDNLTRQLQPRMVNAVTNAETSVYGARTEAQLLKKSQIMYAGLDLRVEEADGTRSREMLMGPMAGRVFLDNVWQNGRIIRPAAFAELQQELSPQTHLTVSTRLELTQAEALNPALDGAGEQQKQWGLSLSTGVEHYLNNNWTVSLWASRTQRSASLSERFINSFPIGVDPYEIIGNANLDVETNWQSDLSLAFATNNWSSSINFFYSRVEDFIASYVLEGVQPRMMSSPGVRQFQNIRAAERYGFEWQGQWTLSEQFQQQFSMAYTHATDLELDEALPEIAPMDLRYSVQFTHAKTALDHRLQIRHVLEQDRISASFGEVSTPSFTTIDWSTRFRVNAQLNLNLQVQNLLNEQYFEHLNRMSRLTPQPLFAPGRNIILTASYQF